MKGETIIMLEGGSLKGIKQRHRHLAARFARQNDVIYLDEPGNIITVFISREKPLSNLWSWMSGFTELEDGIHYWTPPPGLPFGYIYPFLNTWNHFWYKVAYPIVCRKFPKEPILFIHNPLGIQWLGYFHEKYRIYDCCDEITGFKIQSWKPEVVKAMEKSLIEKCDLLICTSQDLYSRKHHMAEKSALVRNACEVEHFNRALDGGFPRPPELEGVTKPVVGFFGYLGDWLNWDIVRYIILNAPEYFFLLIGPTTKGLTQFIEADNVYYTGPMQYEKLPQYLAHFDVAILPFTVNPMTIAANPVKGYEYLAGGAPFVATDLPEMAAFGEFVYKAKDGPTFLAAIKKAMEEDSPRLRAARAKFVSGQTWDARLEEIYTAVRESGGP